MNALKIICVVVLCIPIWAADKVEEKIYLQPNTTQIFTELYQVYGLLSPPARTFFENTLYLDQFTLPNIVPMQPSNQAIFDHANQVLTQFYTHVHELELYVDPTKPKPFFYTAVGSKHLIVALVYAIAMSEPDKKFVFVEQAPYYSGHPNAVTGLFQYPNARFLAFHDLSEIKLEPGEVVVEFVTSPNNPDGKFRKPLTDAQIIIADFVFASSAFGTDGTGYLTKNIEWIREARAAGKHVFSFNSASKQFGKTGTRCGYIWYPMYDDYAALIFKRFFNFISFSTVAAGSSGIAEFLDLIKALLDLPDTGETLRQDALKSLMKRHELVERELLNNYPGSTILSVLGSPTFFAKIQDERIPAKGAAEVILEDFGAVVNNGEPMGETNAFVRLNLSGYSQGLVAFLNRLANQDKYKEEDLLLTSANECSYSLITARGSTKTTYFVRPGDCLIDADASKGAIEILFPPFIDYEKSGVVTIKKIDSSQNPITVHAENAKVIITKRNEKAQLQWRQPLYHNGRWHLSLVKNPE